MRLAKTARSRGAVGEACPHQDRYFSSTSPQSLQELSLLPGS